MESLFVFGLGWLSRRVRSLSGWSRDDLAQRGDKNFYLRLCADGDADKRRHRRKIAADENLAFGKLRDDGLGVGADVEHHKITLRRNGSAAVFLELCVEPVARVHEFV